jgi:hypothetical protein
MIEDITGIFTSEIELPLHQIRDQISKLDLWIELTVHGRVVMSGVISNHHHYPDGMRILTSSVEGYSSDAEGNVYALTRNSKYLLGDRLSVQDESHLFKAAVSAMALDNMDKMTIC